MSEMCECCPFAGTEMSERVQNLGCLPTPQEALALAKEAGRPWGCHEVESRACAGFVAAAKREGLVVKGRPISYKRWYHKGTA